MGEKRTRRTYAPELKEQVIQALISGTRIADVAARFDVPQQLVNTWKMKAKKDGRFDGAPIVNRIQQSPGSSPWAGYSASFEDNPVRPMHTASGMSPMAPPEPLPPAGDTPAGSGAHDDVRQTLAGVLEQMELLVPRLDAENDTCYLTRARGYIAGLEHGIAICLKGGRINGKE